MFAGHYGPAFAAKALPSPPSMGAAFLAVQLVDVAWAIFILTGVEHARIVPGFLAQSDLDLYDMPWTHSLVAALGWSAAAALVYRLADRKSGWMAAWAIGALVLSHWLLDFLVHAPDLPLWPGGPKVGLGWWNVPVLAWGSELIVFAAGFALYLGATSARGVMGRLAPWLVAALMLAVLVFDKFGPPPPRIETAAQMALGAYVVFALLGFWLDGCREVRRAAQRAT
jgi:hypothetical protein